MASSSYDKFKMHEGRRYTGMQIGRGHKWRYDAGDWVEKKVTPEKWEFKYAVTKRRKGKAPEGSGAPVGTGYRWYILAEQVVTKLDANSYSTEMTGHKYKLSHRRADKDRWASSERAQRKALVRVLQAMLDELEAAGDEDSVAPRPVTFDAADPKKKRAGRDGASAKKKRSGVDGAKRKKKPRAPRPIEEHVAATLH